MSYLLTTFIIFNQFNQQHFETWLTEQIQLDGFLYAIAINLALTHVCASIAVLDRREVEFQHLHTVRLQVDPAIRGVEWSRWSTWSKFLYFKSSYFVSNHDSSDFISNKTSSRKDGGERGEREIESRNEGTPGISSLPPSSV